MTKKKPDRRESPEDAYPENANYYDKGCKLAPSCLACPLAECYLDLPKGGIRVVESQRRKQKVADLLTQGHSTTQMAKILGCNIRTISRFRAELKVQS